MRLRWFAAALAAGLLVAGITASAALWSARAELLAARGALEEGQRALSAGRIPDARRSFGAAQQATRRSQRSLSNPVVGLVAAVPLAGDSVVAVRALAEAGAGLAAAGVAVTAAGDRLSGSFAAPGIALAPMQAAAEDLRHARVLAEDAAAAAGSIDGLLVPPVSAARDEAMAHLEPSVQGLEAASELAAALPLLLGADRPRHYFFGAANPAELRGTGGFIGAYAILTLDGGRVDVGPYASISEIPPLPADEVEPPNPSYELRYARHRAGTTLHNINMTPDFPSAAVAIERLVERQTGQALDGAIVADPQALRALLEVTGPTELPPFGAIHSDGVVDLFSNEAYALLPDSDARKRRLGEVAGAILERFMVDGAREDPLAAGRTLAALVARGHVQVHAIDPRIQRALELTGAAGALSTPEGDFLAVVVNNAAANKADYYTDRAVSYHVELEPHGWASASLRVTLHNRTPTSGLPVSVIGPGGPEFAAGQNVSLLSVFCAPDCRLQEARRDGVTTPVEAEEELGLPVFTRPVGLLSGERSDLEYRWEVPAAWEGDADGGTYRLTIRPQTTIRPTALHLSVEVPEGMQIVSAGGDARVRGSRAIWAGTAETFDALEVAFERLEET